MGTWGRESFQNDQARDWYARLRTSRDPTVLVSALSGRLTEAEETRALAAAEVVAAFFGAPGRDLPADAGQWVHEIALDASVRSVACEAVAQIRRESRVRELWDEAGELEEWLLVIDDLVQRLNCRVGATQ
jgi:hypothetical protein